MLVRALCVLPCTSTSLQDNRFRKYHGIFRAKNASVESLHRFMYEYFVINLCEDSQLFFLA